MITLKDKIQNPDSFQPILNELEASFLSQNDKDFIVRMISADQIHLFKDWEEPGSSVTQKKSFLNDLAVADEAYPGGLEAYINNSKRLLASARDGLNPFDGYQPEQPDIVDLVSIDTKYRDYENMAMKNLDKIAVVIVAGGLGERLGYPGIKLNIPIEVITNTTYIKHYCSVVKAMDSRIGRECCVPLIIMTSKDTHDKTIDVLNENNFFGLQKSQVIILRQELVPAIADNDGHIAMNAPYSVTLKPHGHGDIHMLMHMSGTAAQLAASGKKYLLFIQDTNAQVFNAALAAIGVSMKHKFDFNSVAVNRIPGEAVGAITKLRKNNSTITINVEYNQLDPLLRSTISPDGDVPNSKGFSVFPGNINVLVLNIATYVKVLKESGGIIAEFVNPKYNDESRTTFKKPTRLETMMQDLPKLFHNEERVGVTIFDRAWCFSANKNNIADAKAKHAQGGPPESGASAESDFYQAARMKLQLAGNIVNAHKSELIMGIPFTRGPKVILSPRFALSINEVNDKIKNVDISDESTLVLDGENISIDGLKMSGKSALLVRAENGAAVSIKNCEISNSGFDLVLLEQLRQETEIPEYLKIRGYKFIDTGAKKCEFDKPGIYNI